MVVHTSNFHPDTDPKMLCTCGHPDCDQRSINQSTLDKLQMVRELRGSAVVLTSGGRCKYHPDEAKKNIPGDHFKGFAGDVAVSGGVQRGEMVALGLEAGFNAIGIAKTFVHLGYRPELRDGEHVMWVY